MYAFTVIVVQVYFILSGEMGESDIRQVPHGTSQFFSRAGIDSFLMAAPRYSQFFSRADIDSFLMATPRYSQFFSRAGIDS